MFTRKRFSPPQLSGDAGILAQSIANYLLQLESPGAVSIAENTLQSTNLQFPATQVDSADANTLDDYEEGTWVPVFTFDTPGNLTTVYSVQVGRYTKIGRLVTVTFEISLSTFTHTTAVGSAKITGLPFTSENVAAALHHGACSWAGITKAGYTDISLFVISNDTGMRLRGSGSGVAIATIAVGDMPTGGAVVIRGTVAYNV